MNIKEIYPIKMLNIEEAMKNAPACGSGTFKKICDGVYNGTISLLVNNNGDIVGGNYESGKVGAEDSIEQQKFEREYCGLPIMTYLEKAVSLFANHVKIKEIHEDGPEIYVIADDGKRYDIYAEPEEDDYDEDYDDYDYSEELPDELPLDVLGIKYEDITNRSLRKAIKNYTGYFVAKDAELDIDGDYVVGITYGRKASPSELDY